MMLCLVLQPFSIYSFFTFQHGEPGLAVVDLQPVDVVVAHILRQILSPVSSEFWRCIGFYIFDIKFF